MSRGTRGARAGTRTGARPMLRMPSVWIAIVILAAIGVLTVFGSALAPQNPLQINSNALFQGPSLAHLLGTDYLGRAARRGHGLPRPCV